MVKTPILQFGTSRFLQAHVDLFVSEALEKNAALGPICIIQSSGDSSRAPRLLALADTAGFIVKTQGLSDGNIIDKKTRVSSVKRTLSTSHDWQEITRIATEEAEIIVSNTGDTGFQPRDADAATDFDQMMSYPAKLLHLLKARYLSGAKPIQIMPMELVANNGDMLKKRLLSLAVPFGNDFLNYLNRDVRWVNSLVDRIVSEPIEPAGAVAEPYALWAIQDQPGLILPCQHPCIQVVQNLEQHEALKLYILNLGHTYLAQQWLLANGDRPLYVREILAEKSQKDALLSLYHDEVIPAFSSAALEERARSYVATTLERFENPFLNHRLADIATHHPEKVARRMLAFIHWANSLGDRTPKPRIEAIIARQRQSASVPKS